MKKNLIDWLIYSAIFFVLSIPFFGFDIKSVCCGIGLGFFGGMLNAIRRDIKKPENNECDCDNCNCNKNGFNSIIKL